MIKPQGEMASTINATQCKRQQKQKNKEEGIQIHNNKNSTKCAKNSRVIVEAANKLNERCSRLSLLLLFNTHLSYLSVSARIALSDIDMKSRKYYKTNQEQPQRQILTFLVDANCKATGQE